MVPLQDANRLLVRKTQKHLSLCRASAIEIGE